MASEHLEPPSLPCVRCLDINASGDFIRAPVQCVYSEGVKCAFCTDVGKSCHQVPGHLTRVAELLCHLIRTASQEAPDNHCPQLRNSIQIVRRDFLDLVMAARINQFNNNIGNSQIHLDYDSEEEEIFMAPLQEAARQAIEEFEELQPLIQQILPSLSHLSDQFLQTSRMLHNMNLNLTKAVVQNYLARRE